MASSLHGIFVAYPLSIDFQHRLIRLVRRRSVLTHELLWLEKITLPGFIYLSIDTVTLQLELYPFYCQ